PPCAMSQAKWRASTTKPNKSTNPALHVGRARRALDQSPAMGGEEGDSLPVLFVAHFLHPLDDLAVETFLDPNMRHRRHWRCPIRRARTRTGRRSRRPNVRPRSPQGSAAPVASYGRELQFVRCSALVELIGQREMPPAPLPSRKAANR